MIINIRNGIFETNSSSIHAIAIKDRKKRHESIGEKYALIHNGILFITFDSMFPDEYVFSDYYIFSSLFQKLFYIINRASYCWTEKQTYKWLKKDIYPILKKYIENFKEIKFFNIYFTREGNADEKPYILKILEEKEINLEDFLTDDSYEIICDRNSGHDIKKNERKYKEICRMYQE